MDLRFPDLVQTLSLFTRIKNNGWNMGRRVLLHVQPAAGRPSRAGQYDTSESLPVILV